MLALGQAKLPIDIAGDALGIVSTQSYRSRIRDALFDSSKENTKKNCFFSIIIRINHLH